MSSRHVENIPIGSLLRRRSERGTNRDPLLSVTQDKGVVLQENAGRRNISSADRTTYWRVYPDDIVYNTMRMWQGASARSDYFGVVSPAYTVCTPLEGFSSRYIAYALKLPEHIAMFRSRSQGITSDVWNLRFQELAKISMRIVCGDERRRRIAEVLSLLDTTIAQTEALIAKTQQIKAALVHDLCTRGVMPDGQLRPAHKEAPRLYRNSPLGWIPKGWIVGRLERWLAGPPKNGYSPREADDWTGRLMLGLGCLTPDGFSPLQLKNAPTGDPRVASSLLAAGDVLISRANTRELVGLVGMYCDVGHPCSYPDLMMRLRPTPGLQARFLELALRSPLVRRQIEASAVGTSSSMVKISGAVVRRLEIAAPDEAEQHRIVAKADSLGQKAEAERITVGKLSALKSGLMHDLLNGRVLGPAPATEKAAADV